MIEQIVIGGESRIEDVQKHYTEEIRRLVQATASNIVAIGRMLHWGQMNLQGGRFYQWVKIDLGWTIRQADIYINVYNRFGDLDLEKADVQGHALQVLSRYQLGSVPVQEARALISSGERVTVAEAYMLEKQNPSAELDEKIQKAKGVYKQQKEYRAAQKDAGAPVPITPLPPQRIERHEIPAEQLWRAMQHLQVMLVECYNVPLRSPVARALVSFQSLLPPMKSDTIDIVVLTDEATQ